MYSAIAQMLQYFANMQIRNVARLVGKRDNPISDAFNSLKSKLD